jgi:hypothetical protein
MPTDPVHINYRRSGGLAGIDMVARVELRELPAEVAQVVTTLITDPPAGADQPGRGGVPDGFSHELTIEDGDRTYNYQWQDPLIPDFVRPLLTALGPYLHPSPPR